MSDSGLLVGRARDSDVVLDDGSVSSTHARLVWDGDRVLLEDLDSRTGIFVRGKRRERARVRPGESVLIGQAALPWSHPRIRALIERGTTKSNTPALRLDEKRFVCGACHARGRLPSAPRRQKVECTRCGARLELVEPLNHSRHFAAVALGVAALVFIALVVPPAIARLFSSSASPLPPTHLSPAPASAEEASIRARVAGRVASAVDAEDPSTRNLAVRLAASDQGPFHVEQVARIWSHVRERWRYVADPRGGEYFARASETIENELAGDCDDFAAVLAAMVEAIGGRARIVMVDGDDGGHAYAEACVDAPASEVADHLAAFYRAEERPITDIHFRRDATCPVWLNLDWNAPVPGGPYGGERWAVAIHPDGRTETLAPARLPSAEPVASPPVE